MNKIIFFLLFLISSVGFAAPVETTYTGPVPKLSEDLKDLQWYRYTTKNFEILSIDREQGVWLSEYLEKLKTWTQKRWGLTDIPYGKQCMVICVPQQEIFSKWFRQRDIVPAEVETKNVDGSPRQVYVIWISGDTGFLTNSLPEKFGLVNLINYESTFSGVKLPQWMHTGMSALNNDVKSVRTLLGSLDQNKTYDIRSIDNKGQAAAVCLFLKKQHDGSARFVKFMEVCSKSSLEQAIRVYGWTGYNDFNRSLNAYVRALVYDIRVGKTPDMGITWFLSEPIR